MNIKILEAIEDDVLGMQVVYHRAWLTTYPNEEAGITVEDIEDYFKDAYSESTIEKSKDALRNLNRNTTQLLVAKDDEKIVGVCRLVKFEDKNQLKTIYVLPEYQGKGIGTLLWQEILKFSDPEKDIFVEVATYNAQAIGFYSKLGFQDTGRRFTEERFRFKGGATIPEMEMVRRWGE